MATIKYLPAALEDIGRLGAFLADEEASEAATTVALLLQGVRVLQEHPLIGRPIAHDRRELLVFRGRSGYVVQYTYRPEVDEVWIAAVRHQRELDS